MKDYAVIVKVFKAFCDENRIQILEALRESKKCGCVLLEDLKISQPTLLHHMKVLCDSGIIEGRKDGIRPRRRAWLN